MPQEKSGPNHMPHSMGIIQTQKWRKDYTLQTTTTWRFTVLRHGAQTVGLSGFRWKAAADSNVKGAATKDRWVAGRSFNGFCVAKELHLLGITKYYLWMNKPEILHILLESSLSITHLHPLSSEKTVRTEGSKLVRKDTATYQYIYKLFPT